jgi:Uma2 family endonuclease
VVLLARRPDFYRDAHPGPSDTLLVIEVADTSIEYDRTRKLQRYALAGVPEVWIVNLVDDLVEVYRQVSGAEYRERVAAGRGHSLSLPGLTDCVVAVADILG